MDVPKLYKALHTFVQNDDVSGFMTGENVPFPAISIKKDDLWVALTLPSPLDPLVEQMLQACFKSIGLLSREFWKIFTLQKKQIDHKHCQ